MNDYNGNLKYLDFKFLVKLLIPLSDFILGRYIYQLIKSMIGKL